MRIVHTADWHLGKTLEGKSRLEEQESFLKFFIEKCNELEPDIILHAGDIYDTPNPPAKAEILFYDALKKLSRGGKCINIVIAGNHDSPERISSAGPLAMEHGIIMCKSLKTAVLPGKYGKHEVIDSGEGWLELAIGEERAVLIYLPYPSEKRLDEILYGEEEDEKQRQSSYSERVGEIFRNLAKHFRENSINLALSHLFLSGSESAGSERAGSLGGSFLVSANALPKEADYIALGHIHKPQFVPGTGKKACYSGSPIHYHKGEIGFCKKFMVFDLCIDAEKKMKGEGRIWEVDIPVFKPIRIWKAASIEEAQRLCEQNAKEESWVYLEVETERYIREHEIKEMRSCKKDILEIRPVIGELQGAEEEISPESLSFGEQFVEFYKATQKLEPQKELVELLMKILEEDENETDQAQHRGI